MDDRRVIEDILPITEISAACAEEGEFKKSRFGRPFGHPHQIHKWWATRPLVSCRAAVYGSLVSVDQHAPQNGPERKRKALARANAKKFLTSLCHYPGNEEKIQEAWQRILDAQKQRTGSERPPKILDCFAGGGSIPLEALRLGCDTYALDLNPVAYLLELCTLYYPQRYGKADPNSSGCVQGKWAGLADEIDHWANWILKQVEGEIGRFYPAIPNTAQKTTKPTQMALDASRERQPRASAYTPIAYLWTNTVPCRNRPCGAEVPLVKQTWLSNRAEKYVALRVTKDNKNKRPRFEVISSTAKTGKAAIKDFGFDPSDLSKAGSASCIFCGTVVDIDYVKEQGWNGRMSQQLMAIVCIHPDRTGRRYFSPEEAAKALKTDRQECIPSDTVLQKCIDELCHELGTDVPREAIANLPSDSKENSLGITVRPYGLRTWSDLFTKRQLLAHLSFIKWTRNALKEMQAQHYEHERSNAVVTALALWNSILTDYNCILCRWKSNTEQLVNAFGRQTISMVWDFVEANPFGGASGDAHTLLLKMNAAIRRLGHEHFGDMAKVTRGSATQLPYENQFFDAVITDPPYYDNVPYSDISDFFYVWLRRCVGDLYPEHFATELTPKKSEAIADPFRHGSPDSAKHFYQEMMFLALKEIHRVLKPGGILTMVYAHKTVVGWSTLVNAVRKAGFLVTEAWPLKTEMALRLRAMDSSALASSIFIVCRKREASKLNAGQHLVVKRELEEIVRERIETLWSEGISGADLIISCVGAGLKAFTQYEKVELPNGEDVLPERFLAEVEGVVEDAILEHLFGSRASVSAVDPPTRFYVLWRYAYGQADVDSGEAIVFSYPLGIELDGPEGLSTGSSSLLERKGKMYRLKDFSERGDEERLGMDPRFGTEKAPLIDVLHRLVWLVENRRLKVTEFLDIVTPDGERLRLVAQALSGAALEGSGTLITTDEEHGALKKLVSNWSSFFKVDLMRK
jgi:putative DNA methylase